TKYSGRPSQAMLAWALLGIDGGLTRSREVDEHLADRVFVTPTRGLPARPGEIRIEHDRLARDPVGPVDLDLGEVHERVALACVGLEHLDCDKLRLDWGVEAHVAVV